jgi:CRP/FNR family cyclic AMP-dependent transcriptional regulator
MAKSIAALEGLLAALPADLSHGLFAKAHTIPLSADQILFSAGDKGDGCYHIDQGLLKASVTEPGGGERILAVLGPGSVVGELSMIDGVPRSASVIALRDSKLSFISRAAFQAFGEARPELYRYLTTLLARRLRFTNDIVAATSFLSLKGRVARVLLSLAEEFGRPPPPCRATKNFRRWRDAPIDTKCNFDRRIVVVCCPELERVRPVIVRGSTAPPAQVHQ